MKEHLEEQQDISVEEHNYLTDMGFIRKEFSDGSGFWYSLVNKNVGFFYEVDIIYEPDNGKLIFSIQLTEDCEPMEFTYFEEMWDLIMIESILIAANIIPNDDNRRFIS